MKGGATTMVSFKHISRGGSDGVHVPDVRVYACVQTGWSCKRFDSQQVKQLRIVLEGE